MDLRSKRCGCGTIWTPVSLMSRETRCAKCLDAERTRVMEARKGEVALPLNGWVGGGVRRDVCATGTPKPGPAVEQRVRAINEAIDRVSAARREPFVAALKQAADIVERLNSEQSSTDEVVWQDVSSRPGWAPGVMFTAMPDGRALVAGWDSGSLERGYGWAVWPVGTTVDHHPAGTHTTNGLATSREASKAAAIAKWRELTAKL